MKRRSFLFLTILIVLLGLSDCEKEDSPVIFGEYTSSNTSISIPGQSHQRMKIAVMPGLSYLDPSLMLDCLGEGSDFREVLSTDNVIEEFCEPILNKALLQLQVEKPDLLLIPGELTFNGEKISHEALAQKLKKISEKGIKVFVIPGNKDINNPKAMAYIGNGSTPTPSITPEEFEIVYKNFGFKGAISRDPVSLSYLTPAFDNVWILGIDARIYPITSTGRINPDTMKWIKDWLAIAQEQNITVLPICHHAVTEQWVDEAIYGPAYVIKDHSAVETALTDAGLRIIFTATANDITMFSNGDKELYDISTGLLLSPPFPYRIITIDPNLMNIETRHITSINAKIPGHLDFLDYSYNYYLENMTRYFINVFKISYGLPVGTPETPHTAAYYAPYFAKALHAFYCGDEQIPLEEKELSDTWPFPYGFAFQSLYSDLPPCDEQYTINMK